MESSRTKAILNALRVTTEQNVARNVMKIFGASSIEECLSIYDSVGRAERASLDEGVERMAASASPGFWARVRA